MIKTIIFDFDGVILESVDIKTKAFAKLFEQEGQDVVNKVVDYHLQNTGISRFDKFKFIYKNILSRKLLEKTFNDLCQKFSRLVLDEVIKTSYVDGAREFLDTYSGKYKCFVISATPQDEIGNIIKIRKMTHYFRKVYGSPKRKSDIVNEIIIENNLLPDEVVYIGDALSDYEAAKTNSVGFIARINNNEDIFKKINCIKLKDLTNLKDIIQNNFNTDDQR